MKKYPSPDALQDARSTKGRDKSLRNIYEEHTGKISDKWSIYLDAYEDIFADFRNKPVRLLEIGVQNGGSLEIWRQYFPQAELIVGCDINAASGKLTFDDEKIAVIVGDANTADVERDIVAQTAKFDIIIDDGSHRSSDIIRSFARYFPHLAVGGLYVAEDLHCSYWGKYEGGLYDPLSSMSFFKRLLDVVNYEHWGLHHLRVDVLAAFSQKYDAVFEETSLASIHSIGFLNSLCIVAKRPSQENVLGPRRVEGRVALVEGSMLALNGTVNIPIDETGNPWSLRRATMEEEIETNRELVEHQMARIEALSNEIAQRDVEIANEIAQHDAEIARLAGESKAHEALAGQLLAEREQARSEEKRLRSVLDAVYASTSWRVAMPMRAAKRLLVGFGKVGRKLTPGAHRTSNSPVSRNRTSDNSKTG
ncbi:class I SAM-dependent methyltransferase [Mesorhizobium sp. L103C105A0]|uniref:class I SAM-dependent methyltransferase n=1 Tax=Mesorhizobium sp. L103C105A0 TaxID=1287074 RepID=UPI0003CFE1C7|nr:class I SAM-dependent methyltransferase [Mesorhizobium sp. L103C105A0]ESZ75230.1 hypothetical protein X726_17670 [Mesorhizobium sp. L103C105A0]